MEKKRIVRFTRHKVTQEQLQELTDVFGEVEVIEVPETLPATPKDAVARFDDVVAKNNASIVEVVLPINLLEAVLKFSEFSRNGGVILRSVMKREGSVDVIFTFDYYEIVKEITVVTVPLRIEDME